MPFSRLVISLITLIFALLAGCGPQSEPADGGQSEAAPPSDPVGGRLRPTDLQAEADDRPQAASYDPARDYFSYANTGEFVSHHLELNLTADFEAQVLRGEAILHLRQINPGSWKIVLDSRGLEVSSVQRVRADGTMVDLPFGLGASHPVLGEPLTIELDEGGSPGDEIRLKIRYQTGPDASALMWLPPELTAGGEHPFMFTQSQSIHARSWVPLQDTPAARITYEAIIHTPPELLALMSADNDPTTPRNGQYRFSMPQSIPSYLLALAVGNVFFESFGDETGVYAEPEALEAAAWEFADTQAMLDAAEAIYGPYRWGRYDLLILPPSFPYGGMENPRLSFITPTVLAGDRSLTSMIAHELAHSWSGNLVSNATWRDIWLNEGTTSYLEARLMEVLYGKDRADEERVLTYQALLEGLQTVPPEMQALAPIFESGDPDVGQDGLEYAKGQLLLETLEDRFGREVFDPFLAAYFEQFAMLAISTETFLEYIDAELLQKHPGVYSRDALEEWLYQPGVPDTAKVPTSSSLERAAAAAAAWSGGELTAEELPADDWSPQAMVYFIKALPPELTAGQLAELDNSLGLSESGNAEITRAWFMQVAARRFKPAYDAMRDYLERYGRARLVKPVYQALVANGADRDFAWSIYETAKDNYHPVTQAGILPFFD